MSKMGRHVYQLQEAEEKEEHDQDRKGHSNPATHPLARVTIFGDGGLERRAGLAVEQTLVWRQEPVEEIER